MRRYAEKYTKGEYTINCVKTKKFENCADDAKKQTKKNLVQEPGAFEAIKLDIDTMGFWRIQFGNEELFSAVVFKVAVAAGGENAGNLGVGDGSGGGC